MLLIKSHKASTKYFTESIALILGQSLDFLLLLNSLQPIFPTRTILKNASLIHTRYRHVPSSNDGVLEISHEPWIPVLFRYARSIKLLFSSSFNMSWGMGRGRIRKMFFSTQ